MRGTATVGPVLELIPARRALLGPGLVVRRALPRGARRSVGPWCFLDHFGPVEAAGAMNLPPHPHIGLQTVTWLLEGELLHRDSLGSVQRIRPGQLNWMTAGEGIVHSEEAPPEGAGALHGVQLWVALPPDRRRCPPAFEHHATLPRLAEGATALTLLAGRLGGMESPATAHSPLVGLDVALPSGGRVRLPLDPSFEHAVLVMEGSADAAGHAFGLGELLYLGDGRHHLDLSADEPARLLLIGGPPLPAPLAMWWNFVGGDREELEQARQRWEAGGFPPVPGATLPPEPAPSPGPRG